MARRNTTSARRSPVAPGSVAATALLVTLLAADARANVWNLVWNDEFSGPSLNQNNWWVSDIQSGVNSEWEYYTPNHVFLDGNGHLVIQSDDGCTDTHGNGHPWCSGELQGYFPVTQGMAVEWRTQVPETQGIWPSNWLVSFGCPLPVAQGGCSSWPPEIDVMEMIDTYDNNGFTDWWNVTPDQEDDRTSCQSPAGCSPPSQISATFAQNYHTFRVEWFSDVINYMVDGYVTSTHTNQTEGTMRVVMNSAIGGGSTGGANASSVWPQYQNVDYVRIYQLGGVLSGASYRFSNRASGKVLDDDGGGYGAQQWQWDNWDAPNQHWQFNDEGENWFQAKNVRDGTCLDDTNGSTAAGNIMQTYGCGGNSNQSWWPFDPGGRGWNQLSVETSNLCLDDTNGSWSNGNTLQQWTCTGDANQSWEIVQVP